MIGIDMEKISRFEHWTDEGYKRIFAESEIEYVSHFENKLERYAGFFCVKEAFVKALDDMDLRYSSIEILHTESGKPYINMTPYIQSILREHHASRVDISVSHCKDHAIAVVLVE